MKQLTGEQIDHIVDGFISTLKEDQHFPYNLIAQFQRSICDFILKILALFVDPIRCSAII